MHFIFLQLSVIMDGVWQIIFILCHHCNCSLGVLCVRRKYSPTIMQGICIKQKMDRRRIRKQQSKLFSLSLLAWRVDNFYSVSHGCRPQFSCAVNAKLSATYYCKDTTRNFWFCSCCCFFKHLNSHITSEVADECYGG